MAEHDLKTLDAEIENAKKQLEPQIRDICAVITGDLPNFVLKQVRTAFIEDVKFAESKSDAELSELKKRIAEFGKKLAEDIKAQLLCSLEAWWGQEVSLEKTGKTLEGNTQIWKILSTINDSVSHFIQSEGLKMIEIRYTTPARFIEGNYLPGKIEKYWAQLAALRALEEERAAAYNEARKTRQASRWDSI